MVIKVNETLLYKPTHYVVHMYQISSFGTFVLFISYQTFSNLSRAKFSPLDDDGIMVHIKKIYQGTTIIF